MNERERKRADEPGLSTAVQRSGAGLTTRDLPARPLEKLPLPASEEAQEALAVQRRTSRAFQHRIDHDAFGLGAGTEQTAEPSTEQILDTAARGVSGASERLPFMDVIQASFGEYDVGGIHAHVGGDAGVASRAIGADAYATGDHVAFGASPDLHTAAHEAAHVVQQRDGVSLRGGVGEAGDAYEQHADAVADRVVAGQSAADLLGAASGAGARRAGPGVQLKNRRGREPFVPRIKPHPRTARIAVGQKHRQRFEIENDDEVPRGTKFTWGGGLSGDRSAALLGFDGIEHTRHSATVSVVGEAPGTAGVRVSVIQTDPDGSEHRFAIEAELQVGSNVESSASDLQDIVDQRNAGRRVDPEEELRARQEGVAASQAALKVAKGDVGTEVNLLISGVLDQIQAIETSRADGYIDAVLDLAVKNFDKTADYDAFGRALTGNLIWALSGLASFIPGGGLLGLGVKAFFAKHSTSAPALLNTAVGLAGAMTAQYAAGTPSSSSPSGAQLALKNGLLGFNSAVCESMRRRLYALVPAALAENPPAKATDAQAYVAELEVAIRHLLFGEVYASGMNDGADVSTDAMRVDAKHQLLSRYLATNAAVSGGKFTAVRGSDAGENIGHAVDLMDPDAAFDILGAYGVVQGQIEAAAQNLGCRVEVDPQRLVETLGQGKDLTLPLSGYSPAVLFSNYATTKWNALYFAGVVDAKPDFDGEEMLAEGNVPSIMSVQIRAADLAEATLGTHVVKSANSLTFNARGEGGFISEISQDKVPNDLHIVYRLKP